MQAAARPGEVNTITRSPAALQNIVREPGGRQRLPPPCSESRPKYPRLLTQILFPHASVGCPPSWDNSYMHTGDDVWLWPHGRSGGTGERIARRRVADLLLAAALDKGVQLPWNEEFQSLQSGAAGGSGGSMINVPWLEGEETAVRVKACKEAFNLAAEWVVKKLIQDGDSNEESGSSASIPALQGMGVAGGSKYCVLGIFFKFSQDTKGCLYGDDIEAAKAALADMRHAAHILHTLSLTEGKGGDTSSSGKAAAPASATAANADHQDQDDDSNRSPLDDLSLLYDGPGDSKEDDDDDSGDSAYDGPGDFEEMLTLTTMDSYEPEGSLYYGGLEADDADTVATAAAAEQVVVNVMSTDRGTDSGTEEESESDLVRLHFPLVTLLRLCGRVVLAVAQLPVSQHTMVAGSGDAGRTVAVPPTTKLQNSLEQMCRALGIIPHLAGSSKTTQAKVYGPVDMEIHCGHDARHYILDLHRMMPCEAPLQNVSAVLLAATAGRDIDGSRRGGTDTQLVPVSLRARGAELRQIVRRVRV